ncbi:MAG: NAD(P)-dependent oxidoreductase [Alphaproteobacteria bacterium]|nr:NAD(P)-dependent oxidoreductase [Alphaproteobacteria bacterium]
MAEKNLSDYTIGWIGAGRMGFPMAERLLKAGCDVTIYNRTKSKAEPLTKLGGKLADSPADLADRDIVFTMVSGPADLLQVTTGENGVLSVSGTSPKMVVDCSSVSEEASAEVRAAAAKVGTAMLAAPVSGNAKVVKAGKLSIVASGPEDSFKIAEPYLNAMSVGVSYVGDGELARMVKICHNVLLGVTIQNLVEITILAEKGGVPRHAFLDFINKSVMGSMFTAYKTPAIVNLDYTPTFTPPLLHKDLELGLAAAKELGVPMPLTSLTSQIVQSAIGLGHVDTDFSILLDMEAKASGMELKSENVDLDTGL